MPSHDAEKLLAAFCGAGACPAGREPGASGHCDYVPTCACVKRPAACNGAVSCSCAALCLQSFMCLGSASTTFLSCVEAVP